MAENCEMWFIEYVQRVVITTSGSRRIACAGLADRQGMCVSSSNFLVKYNASQDHADGNESMRAIMSQGAEHKVSCYTKFASSRLMTMAWAATAADGRGVTANAPCWLLLSIGRWLAAAGGMRWWRASVK